MVFVENKIRKINISYMCIFIIYSVIVIIYSEIYIKKLE